MLKAKRERTGYSMSTKRLMGLFAHPDDEGSLSGALLKYSISGDETGLVCATRGEVGEIADPALATPENLGQVREGEMRAAAEVLGVHNLWFLSYRDSGMAGTPPNTGPRAICPGNPAEGGGEDLVVHPSFPPPANAAFRASGASPPPHPLTLFPPTP